MQQVNDSWPSAASRIAVEEIELFTIGGRPSCEPPASDRAALGGERPRRNAQGKDLTYLVDQTDGATDEWRSRAPKPRRRSTAR